MNVSDPYQWRESVLSTRSLSYVSTFDALESSPRPPPRNNTITSMASLNEEPTSFDTMISQPLPPSISSSPLFFLPRDIRDLIWTFLLHSDTELQWPSETPQCSQIFPQVLLTCKAVFEEAAHALYTTNTLSFVHPSDANMFVHAIASPDFAPLMPHLTLRIRSQDTRLWTSWFNSNSPERSLIRDFPSLQQLTIRYRGPRWNPQLSEKANADAWLKDPKLQEIILSVRKCVTTVRLLLCVRLPNEVIDELTGGDDMGEEDRLPHVMFRRWAWLNGCYIRVEPIGGPDD